MRILDTLCALFLGYCMYKAYQTNPEMTTAVGMIVILFVISEYWSQK